MSPRVIVMSTFASALVLAMPVNEALKRKAAIPTPARDCFAIESVHGAAFLPAVCIEWAKAVPDPAAFPFGHALRRG